MALVELVLKQRYFSKDVFNVFHYFCTDNDARTAAQYQNLAEVFDFFVVPKLNAIQAAGVTNESIKVTDIGNTNLQVIEDSAGAGTWSTDPLLYLPREQTFPVRYSVFPSRRVINRELYEGNRRITDGYKRFTGVCDDQIASGAWTNAFEVSEELQDLMNALNAPLVTVTPAEFVWEPTVYGRAIAETPRLPAREALYALVNTTSLEPVSWTRKRK